MNDSIYIYIYIYIYTAGHSIFRICWMAMVMHYKPLESFYLKSLWDAIIHSGMHTSDFRVHLST